MRRVLRTYGLSLLWLTGALLIAWGGTQPGYRPGNPEQDPSPYPILWVIAFLAVSALELAIAHLILRPRSYERSWRRALLAALVFVPWSIACMAVTMHMPGFVTAHALWVFVLAALSLVLLFVSGISTLWLSLRSRAV